MRKNLMTMLLILALAATGLNPGMTAQASETDTEKEVYTLDYTDGAKAPSKNGLQEGNALFETAFYSPTLYMAASSEATTQNTKSGKINDTVSWTFSNGTLRITGTGELKSDDPDANKNWTSKYSYKICSLWPDLEEQIKTVIVDDGITSIGYASFFNCTALESVTLAESVKEIGYIAFANCFSLKKFDAPGAVTFKGQSMAYTGLESFHFGKDVQAMTGTPNHMYSDPAFMGTRLETISVDEENPYFATKDNVLFTKDMKTLMIYPSGSKTTSYTIPDGVERIEDSAFFGCRYLNELTISEGVQEFGRSVFSWCEQLKEIKLPDSLTTTDYYTFSDCHALERVTFGNGLKETPMGMFENCSSLTSIDFGNKLEKIGTRTFAACSALENVILPENITYMDHSVFGNCYNLKEFTCLGLKCGIFYQSFLNDRKLTTVKLNEGVEGLARSSFLGCYGLEKILLPKSVIYVHPYACETKTTLIALNTELTPFGKHGLWKLETIPVSGIRLYTEAYKVLDLVNEARAEQNLPALEMDESLLESAMQRAAELSVLFAHTRPDSSSCFEINKENLMSGENIAYGRNNAQDTMTDWMNSDGHRENILLKDFKSIGIGCVEINGEYYWTQCFGGRTSSGSFDTPQDQPFEQEVGLATETFGEATTGNSLSWGKPEEYTFRGKITLTSTYAKPGEVVKWSYQLLNPGLERYFTVDSRYLTWNNLTPDLAEMDSDSIKITGNEGSIEVSASLKKGSYASNGYVEIVSEPTPTETPTSKPTETPKIDETEVPTATPDVTAPTPKPSESPKFTPTPDVTETIEPTATPTPKPATPTPKPSDTPVPNPTDSPKPEKTEDPLPQETETNNPNQPAASDQPGTGILYGDADRNGSVDANDALLVLKIAARLVESIPETESIADVDGNKTVDANDALLILQKAAKLIDRFPIEG